MWDVLECLLAFARPFLLVLLRWVFEPAEIDRDNDDTPSGAVLLGAVLRGMKGVVSAEGNNSYVGILEGLC